MVCCCVFQGTAGNDGPPGPPGERVSPSHTEYEYEVALIHVFCETRVI